MSMGTSSLGFYAQGKTHNLLNADFLPFAQKLMARKATVNALGKAISNPTPPNLPLSTLPPIFLYPPSIPLP